MKRFFKYLGRTILAILGLLLLIVFLLYLPPVQDFLLRKAERYAASHYDLEVRIGHFRLGFPFDLVLDDVYAGKTAGDTLVAAEAIRLRVNIDRIFRKELGIEQLGLRQVKFGLAGDTTGMQLKVAVGNLGVQEGRIDLERKKLIVAEISLEEGDVFLKSGAGTVEDTVHPGRRLSHVYRGVALPGGRNKGRFADWRKSFVGGAIRRNRCCRCRRGLV